MTDPNNLSTTYQYDNNLRPTAANLPTGATATASYSDNTLTTTSGLSWTDGGVNKSVSSTSVSDWKTVPSNCPLSVKSEPIS